MFQWVSSVWLLPRKSVFLFNTFQPQLNSQSIKLQIHVFFCKFYTFLSVKLFSIKFFFKPDTKINFFLDWFSKFLCLHKSKNAFHFQFSTMSCTKCFSLVKVSIKEKFWFSSLVWLPEQNLDKPECRKCAKALQELENIDDEADQLGIGFVKIHDEILADEYNLGELPRLVYYRHKTPIIYESMLKEKKCFSLHFASCRVH